jgi:hypothetical protein
MGSRSIRFGPAESPSARVSLQRRTEFSGISKDQNQNRSWGLLEKEQEIHGRPGSKAEGGPGADPQRCRPMQNSDDVLERRVEASKPDECTEAVA